MALIKLELFVELETRKWKFNFSYMTDSYRKIRETCYNSRASWALPGMDRISKNVWNAQPRFHDTPKYLGWILDAVSRITVTDDINFLKKFLRQSISAMNIHFRHQRLVPLPLIFPGSIFSPRTARVKKDKVYALQGIASPQPDQSCYQCPELRAFRLTKHNVVSICRDKIHGSLKVQSKSLHHFQHVSKTYI